MLLVGEEEGGGAAPGSVHRPAAAARYIGQRRLLHRSNRAPRNVRDDGGLDSGAVAKELFGIHTHVPDLAVMMLLITVET